MNCIPTATNALQAWNQWFTQPLKKFSKEMIRTDRRKYSERLTLSMAFQKYSCYEMIEMAYAPHTDAYNKILKEVRRRKKENCL